MPKPTKQLDLTVDEFDLIRRLIKRLKLEGERNPERVGENNIRVINKIEAKFNKEGVLIFFLIRQENRFLQAFLKSSSSSLATKAIPGYKERIKTDAKKYTPYLERAEARVIILDELVKKLEATL